MNTRNQKGLSINRVGILRRSSARCVVLAGLLIMAGAMPATQAANVSLNAVDAAGTSSYNSAGHWNNSAAPAGGNNYFTTNFVLRTPNPTTSGNLYVFGGASLSIDTGGRFLSKIGNNVAGNTTTATILVTNLILNGGTFDQAGANSDSSLLVITGNVSVVTASLIGALGGTANGSASFETMDFTAPISGTAALQVSGPSLNAGGDTGLIRLSAANPYGGTISVSNGVNNIIASSVNRALQLNNLNALSNATLNLDASQASPVSFASAVNTGTFKVGALAGKSPQTLSDTAGAAVSLQVGGNNASTTYSGALTDGGSLEKVGTGTLILTGTNTYSGSTTVTGGSLQLGNGGSGGALPSSGALTINANLTIKHNNSVVQGTDLTGSPITGSGSLTQAGTGTTTLTAANSYSGPTTVSAGKLILSTAQTGTGVLTVSNAARLGVVVSGSSQLVPSTLTLGSGGATVLEFDAVNSTTTAPINAGTVQTGGTVTVNINTGSFVAGNSYPLIHWTTSGPADASAFVLGISPGLTATFSVSGSTLYLNVSAVSDIWAGIVNGNWDTTTANWTGNATIFANGKAVLFDDSAAGNTSITVVGAVQPASMLVNNNSQSYTITSSSGNQIAGTGSLTKQNVGSLTLAGGANTYSGVTAVNNGVLNVGNLANGGQPSDIGAASAASANLVLNGGTLQYNGASVSVDRGATVGASGGTLGVTTAGTILADSGVLAGTGALTKTGDGTLALSGASTLSGGVTVNSGELDINYGGSSAANSAIGTGKLTLGENVLLDNTGSSDVTLLPNNPQLWNSGFTYVGTAHNLNLGTGAVTLATTVGLAVNANTLTVGGVISGSGGITKTGAGTLALAGANTFTGTVDLQVGTLALGNDGALGIGQLNFNGGTSGATIQSLDNTPRTITNALNFAGAGANTIFGGTANLKFTATPTANSTLKVLTVNNPQTEFSGSLGGASARTVAGSGVLVLSGANTYSAGTTINSGATLQLGTGSTNGSLSASGVIDVEGTLRFNRNNNLVQG
ncbi:MAG TPA: autotransporter-associated beta strand repeat-containing protein, partial [Verrucomicrobiae bacterium]